jgi:hypothetical protein
MHPIKGAYFLLSSIKWISRYFFAQNSMAYRKIIQAISSGLSSLHKLDELTNSEPNLQQVGIEIIGQQQRMPDYLRLPITVLTYGFDCVGVFYGGRRFHRLEASQQLQQINAWKSSPIGLCQNFIRFYESLFLLIALQEGES